MKPIVLTLMLLACGAPPRTSELRGVWDASRLAVSQKCAEPRSDEKPAAPRYARLTLLELGASADDPTRIDMQARLELEAAPQLEVEATDTGLRVVMPQGPSVNTAEGVRWRIEGGSIERSGDQAHANTLVVSFDDVGLGARECRYGVLTLEGFFDRAGR